MSLMNFLQAASNSAADTVAAPVDLFNFLLGKAGVNIPEPVGGSAWMERQGLRKKVPQNASSLAGETLGLLSPVVAAAKAPQIAKGLLQHADDFQKYNKAAGPAGASQATVWHGSPHKFDKFDSSKIGTGEGAQAYGHGLYLADSPEVAMSYQPRDMGFESALMKKSELAQRTSNYPAAQVYEDFLLHKTPMEVEQLIADAGYTGGDLARAKAALEFAKKQYFNQRAGALYKVDLPDTAIARMLDWDKPLSQQAPNVISSLGPRVVKRNGGWYVDAGPKTGSWKFSSESEAASEAAAMLRSRDLTGNALHDSLKTGADAETAQMLRSLGIPGIRYLDGGSRGAGAGTSNFVVFPGEEGLLTILERNGVPLR